MEMTGTRIRQLIGCGVLVCVLALSGCIAAAVQPQDGEGVRACLNDVSAGRRNWSELKVTYDDVHGLYGGLTLTVNGNGQVEQKAVRMSILPSNPSRIEVAEPRDVSRTDLVRLLALLQKIQAWQQRVPPREPVPDESRSQLTIRCGSEATTIWEWYNDMKTNDRIARVIALMREIAWQPKPDK